MSADKLSFEEGLTASGLRLAVIVSRFNSFVTEPLLEGALDAIRQAGGNADETQVIRVPGAWELPITVQTVAGLKKHDAIICLGAVIRGGTPHFDYVAGEASRGLASASLASGIPVAFGLLTTNNEEEATDRAGGKFGNKGFDAAMTAIEMAALLKKLRAEA